MSEENIISPCISVCKTDPISGFCYGCGRSNEEKKTKTKADNLLEELNNINLNTLSPIDSLNVLNDLKKKYND